MIDTGAAQALSPRERLALDALVDTSGVLRIADDVGGRDAAVRLEPSEGDVAPLATLGMPSSRPFAVTDRVVRVPRALLRVVGDLLTQASDRTAARDRHGRPVSAANPLVQGGTARTAVVSRLALALGAAAREAAGGRDLFIAAPWPNGHRWAAALSHDLDVASAWPAFTLLRLAELARRGELSRMTHTAFAAVRSVFGDPVLAGVRDVLAAEAHHGARSTWFLICGTPTVSTMRAGDVTYSPESARVRAILAALRDGAHEVGLHGSFETARDGAAFVAQRKRLGTVADAPVQGVRQHFLKRDPGVTERAMAAAGFTYDSTVGFADRNGFRAGIADVYPLHDAIDARPLGIDEMPFCWMDRAQSKYQGVEEPMRWVDDARDLMAECEAVQGVWCGIWHPNLTTALGFPGAPDAFASLVEHVSTRGAWVATISQIVRWRAARRSLRVTGIRSDGAPTVHGDERAVHAAGFPFTIVDGSGRVRAQVGAP